MIRAGSRCLIWNGENIILKKLKLRLDMDAQMRLFGSQ